MSEDGAGYVFLGGVPRSGLTLLRRLLIGHPAVHCGPDTGLPVSIAMQWQNFARSLGDLHRRDFALEDGQVRSAMANLLTGLLGEPLKSGQKTVLVEKTTLNILAFAPLAEMLPGARFVHVVRDGRDVAASLLRRNWTGPDGQPFAHVSRPDAALQYWSDLSAIGVGAEEALGDRCLRVSYEDLVRAPKRTLTTLLRFAGLEFDKAVFGEVADDDFTALERDSLPLLLGTVVRTRIGAGKDLERHLTPQVSARLTELGYRV